MSNFISIQEKQHYVFIDMAYQGFSTGDLDRDASALRLFVKDGHQLSYAQSFSKNMGLYGKFLLDMINYCLAMYPFIILFIHFFNPRIHCLFYAFIPFI